MTGPLLNPEDSMNHTILNGNGDLCLKSEGANGDLQHCHKEQQPKGNRGPTFNRDRSVIEDRLAHIKVVLFDWKGTLEAVQPDRMEKKKERHFRPLEAMLKCGYTQKGITSLASLDPEEVYSLYLAEKQELEKNHETFSMRTLIFNLLRSLSVHDETISNALYEEFFRVFNTNKRVLMDNAFHLLDRLKQNNFRICLVRNSKLPGEQFGKVLKQCKADQYFEAVILGGDLGYAKPSKEVFQAAVDALQLNDLHNTSPKDILFVGNETEADIVGGNNMGWTTCLIRTTESTSNGLADVEIDSLYELEDLLFGKRT